MNPRPPDVALLPCPFDDGQGLHGSKVRSNDRDGSGPPDTWWVQCKCGAEGPNACDPSEAIAAWNRRAGGTALREALDKAALDWEDQARWHRNRVTMNEMRAETCDVRAKKCRAALAQESSHG